jgi:hypothetical protein
MPLQPASSTRPHLLLLLPLPPPPPPTAWRWRPVGQLRSVSVRAAFAVCMYVCLHESMAEYAGAAGASEARARALDVHACVRGM